MVVTDAEQFPTGRDGIEFSKASGRNIGVLFEGEDGWVQVNRPGLAVYPQSLVRERFGPDDVHLYRSNNHKRNFVDCVRSRKKIVAPAEVGQR